VVVLKSALKIYFSAGRRQPQAGLMKIIINSLLILMLFSMAAISVWAGPYPPAADQAGSTAVFMDDTAFIAWATGWENYIPGDAMSSTWQKPKNALGPAQGTSFDIVSLGRGGEISLTFDQPIKNGPDWDFAVFENSFSDAFLELAYVEVSSDGKTFVRFDNDSLTPNPVGSFGSSDPTDIDGFAGKYRQAYGTPFDLGNLATRDEVLSGIVQLHRITHVKIVDIIGDGTYFDTGGDVIYDPYPTSQSAGFDLDAVGIRYESGVNGPPDQPLPVSPQDGAVNVPIDPVLTSGPFTDPNTPTGDFHSKTRWQIAWDAAFTDMVLDLASPVSLTTLVLTGSLLQAGTTYFWRIQYFDSEDAASEWSDSFSFTTTTVSNDNSGNGIPDDQELDPSSMVDLNDDGIPDVDQISGQYKVLNTVPGGGRMGVAVSGPNVVIEYLEAVDPDRFPETSGAPAPRETLLGLISFRIQVQHVGDTETMTIYFSEPVPEDYQWYKYDSVKGWYVFPDAEFSSDRRSLTLFLTDGAMGDADGLVNGILIDPGGAATNSSGSDSMVIPKSGSSGINGGSSICFISAAADGRLTEISAGSIITDSSRTFLGSPVIAQNTPVLKRMFYNSCGMLLILIAVAVRGVSVGSTNF
jgi:hypothetical protein